MDGKFGVGSILEGRKNEEDDYFKVLGCSDNATNEQIIAEYRIRALQCHPDKHPGNLQALNDFQKLQEAKDTLLDPEKRAKYEKWRQSEMCIPYKQWLGMSGRCATTMHWAKPKEQTMIGSYSDQVRVELQQQFQSPPGQSSSGGGQTGSSTSGPKIGFSQQPYVWRPEKTSSIYSKFRNYKI